MTSKYLFLSTSYILFAIFSSTVQAKSFHDYCLESTTSAQRNTITAVMIKAGLPTAPSEATCLAADDFLKKHTSLTLYPDPFERHRGPASDLSPLEEQTHLEYLSLSQNQITDLAPIATLSHIKTLILNFNPVENISIVSKMLLLEELQISSTGVADLTPLTPLKRLGSLSASNAKLTDLSPLEHLSQLRVLLFEGNEIKDAHPIAALQLEYLQIKKNHLTNLDLTASKSTLKMLDVTANDLHDIVGLDGLSGLDALGLGQNHFVTVRPLTHLQILRWLDIHNNEISDISDLGSLTDLQYLRLDGNHICSLPPAVAKLREEHVNSKGQLIKLEVTGLEHQTGCRESF